MEFLLDPGIWVGLLTLIILEIVLGIDNLVFIAILAEKLPPEQRDKARIIGLSLALIMRLGLLSVISWLVTLTKPIIEIAGLSFSGRDLILLFGGLFLVYKAVTELHEKMEGKIEVQSTSSVVYAGFWAVVAQIIVLDAVFSLDSVITAVGMVDNIYVMMAAVTIAVIVMLIASKPLTAFVNRHPTVVILCLSFLLLIGISLIAEGFGFHIPKGYIYSGIGVAILIEAFNQFSKRNATKHESKIPLRHRTADSILKLMGGKVETMADSAQHFEAQETFADEERYMIGGVLTLAERSVASIMTPRSQISWVNLDDSAEQIREQVLAVPHSLFPVCRGNLDKVLSVVRAKELLDVLEDPEQLKALIKRHRPIYIFEKMKVIDAINTLRSSKGSLVLVSDEFGNVQGLISPLDVFEAIAGEFPDADEQLDLVKIDDHTWKASGMLDVYQLELELGMLDLVEEEAGYISLAGLILEKTHGKVSLGAKLEYRGIYFEVTELEENRIKSVLISYP
ncbi:TerC family protein [Acinetobacter kookii]|uniref:Membrane protein TerC, possibly involved in tellurium resistance n=1 Tax=Acinetobacter kookii TaxID=1226327 RepID=A0A1G6GRP1_9GAMM|nr:MULTISPECIES: transporter associated domain-containing protein [Acinetobacter]MCT8088421.1 CBS domain-containing protein [Acinetobacter sp. F_3_1]MCT8097791.1 CBS domain-containing protein [Acinetobacter sp. C_3_1]MCT8100447.1 CBS domain-containing protein [Acinetobacter sp. C_4_1]MCT8133833.1 CBS domain-containing protein [Acinetobacter sp. T_3_1]SDB84513.1 Membrane protein TerC, possibly involved in tellurium resistance [Acinetobacter kookii]